MKKSTSLLLCASLMSGLLIVSRVAHAADYNPITMLGEGRFPIQDSLEYQFHDAPEHPAGSAILTEERENGQFIVSKTPTDTWAVQERFSHFNISDAVVIPQTNLSIPTSLWSVEGGGSWGHHLNNGRDFGLNFNVGSASDRLFYTIHETVYQLNASYRVPSREKNAWLFFLAYSNNRQFLNNIPLPGVAYYFYELDGKLKAVLGFPFASILYSPDSRWSAQAGLFGPRRANAEVACRIAGRARLYIGFDWTPSEWERANREDDTDRLFFDKKRAMLGVRSPIRGGLNLDLSGGREFDRRFFENDSSSISGVPYASLPPSWYFEVRLAYRFGPFPSGSPSKG